MMHLNLLYSYFVISQLILRNISKLKIDEIISETLIIDSHWPLDKFCASVKYLKTFKESQCIKYERSVFISWT